MIVPAFVCVGDTEEERSAWRERARVQVSFYGSTPNYGFIFDQLDREGTTERIRERQRAGDVAGMAAVIDDDLLEQFTTVGTWDDVADKVVAKYGGIATRVVSYFTGHDVVADPERFEHWARWPGRCARRRRTSATAPEDGVDRLDRKVTAPRQYGHVIVLHAAWLTASRRLALWAEDGNRHRTTPTRRSRSGTSAAGPSLRARS